MKTIEEAVAETEPNGTGRYRFRLTVDLAEKGMYFYSEPVKKEEFLATWVELEDYSDLSAVQYESKTEYTPGHYVWQTF